MVERSVLVVGAGPAGVSAAFYLKKLDTNGDLNVVLIERLENEGYHKYHRMCGEGISKMAFEELPGIMPCGVIEKIDVIRDVYPDGAEYEVKLPGYLINRSVFLEKIKQDFVKLGGNFENECFAGMERVGKAQKVRLGSGKKLFDYIVGADGVGSTVRKAAGIGEGAKKTFVQYVVEGETEHNVIKFFYNQKYNGNYKWVFPNGDVTKIGFPLSETVNPEKELGTKQVIEKHARVIGYGGIKSQCSGRVLLIGDAAFQTNPITKGGIRAAMVAGRYAAEAIALGKPENYDAKWKKSGYNGDLYTPIFERLERMSNNELSEMAKKIDETRYLSFSRVFSLCHKYGW